VPQAAEKWASPQASKVAAEAGHVDEAGDRQTKDQDPIVHGTLPESMSAGWTLIAEESQSLFLQAFTAR